MSALAWLLWGAAVWSVFYLFLLFDLAELVQRQTWGHR